jgi:type I restriction enzyme S subunit
MPLLQDLPKDWELKPLKRAVCFVEGPGIMATDFENDGVPLLRIAGLNGRTASLDGCNFLAPDLVEAKWSHFRVRGGDLLISGSASTGLCAEVDAATAGAIPYTGIIIVRPIDARVDKNFFRWFLLSDSFAIQVALAQTGSAMKHFGPTHLSQMFAPVPPLPRQPIIADYLDHETARLDALVAAKERVLGLLAEKRRALITRAVTRGLDPHARVRGSGIPWLGEIPAHWEIWKLGHVALVGNGSTPNRDNAEYWAEGAIPWLNSSVVNQEEVTASDQFVTATALRECHLPLVKPGSVLVGITGQGKTRGSAVVLSFEATINQHIAFITPNADRLDAWFLRWSLFAAYEFLRSISDDVGGTKGALTCEAVAVLHVPLPPLDDQREIVAHISLEASKLGALRVATERTISLLKERRAALIAAAVTGQIDIREGVA